MAPSALVNQKIYSDSLTFLKNVTKKSHYSGTVTGLFSDRMLN